MPSFDIVRRSATSTSFRAASIRGAYDLSAPDIRERFTGEIDIESLDWKIGAIVGASGTGKSTIAKEVFGDNVIAGYEWSGVSVIDDMPAELAVPDILKTWQQCAFSSVPSWLKPFNVLSTGEQMRVTLARALLDERSLIVFDEFTSVVDRQVAKIASLSIAKSVRTSAKQFIAVSCHLDILEWLQPDWTFFTDTMTFST